MSKNKVGFVSLGCPKALVDSERILTQLKTDGYSIAGDYQGADIVVVNTCGFIDAAKAESIEAIQEALDENGQVIVTGCLSKADKNLSEKFPQILSISGPQQYDTVVNAVHQHLPIKESIAYSGLPESGIKLTPPHYSYLKVSEGCNHKCSFCIIPSLRGKLESRALDSILKEAESLKQSGTKELLIIAQDTSAYGLDLKYEETSWRGQKLKTNFQTLCEQLAKLGIWVRLHYVYPYPHVDKVIHLMSEGHLLPYLDIPFQHAHPEILKAMKRPASSENVLTRINKWREICPDITLRSTFIVGFPGETDAHFESLLQFLDDAQLDRAGCFKYSQVDGAKSNLLDKHVEESVKEERWQRLMEHQSNISAKKLQTKIGTKIEIIIDEASGTEATGRSKGDAPDIDGKIFINNGEYYTPGQIVQLTITDTDQFDCYVGVRDSISVTNL